MNKYNFWKACKLNSVRHVNLSPEDMEGDIAVHCAAPMAGLCPPRQLLVIIMGARRQEGKATLGCFTHISTFLFTVTYSAAGSKVLGTKQM